MPTGGEYKFRKRVDTGRLRGLRRVPYGEKRLYRILRIEQDSINRYICSQVVRAEQEALLRG